MRLFTAVAAVGLLAIASTPTFAGSHTWRVNEVFSNADGTIQFIELTECCGAPNEIFLNTRTVTSSATGSVFTFTSNLVAPTSNKKILLATAGFAALPGAPTPDHIIGEDFISTSVAEAIAYVPYDTMSIPMGMLPTDGVMSLHDAGASFTMGTNSPTNYAGDTGTIDAGGNNPTPAVSFMIPTSSVDESAGSHTVMLLLSDTGGATSEAISVSVSDALSGSATAGVDFGTIPGTHVFPMGSADGATLPIVIPILEDLDPEGPESIALSIDGVVGASSIVGAANTHIVTINDNDGPPPVGQFQRGDVNQDGSINIADPIRLLAMLFQADPVTCDMAGDLNDDNAVDISDAINSLSNLFNGGPDPGEPFGSCGVDPTPGGTLTCVSHAQCP